LTKGTLQLQNAQNTEHAICIFADEVWHQINQLHLACRSVNMPLLPPSVPWYRLTLHFVMDLPQSTSSGSNNITVIVDQVTKMAIYPHYRTDINLPEIFHMYMVYLICIPGIPDTIITDCRWLFPRQF
jgi:hypothetical protein